MSIAWRTLNIVLLLLLPAPLVIIGVISFSADRYLAFPPSGYSIEWYLEFLTSPRWMYALGVSATIAVIAALVTTSFAIMAALALNRYPRWKPAAEMVFLGPLIFPHAAVGVAMFALTMSIVVLRNNYLGIAIVHMIICVPFAYRPISAAFQRLDPAIAEAALNLGATPVQAVWRVILPNIRAGIVTSLIFAFIISFDEITVTLFLVAPGLTTLPVEIFARLEQSADPVVAAASTILIIATLLIVIVLERTIGLEMFVESEASSHAK